MGWKGFLILSKNSIDFYINFCYTIPIERKGGIMDKQTTDVIFRVYKDTGDCVAIFPYDIATLCGQVTTYEHVGQHGSCDYSTILKITRLAKPEQYADLKKELETHFDYRLKVITRQYHKKFAWAFHLFHQSRKSKDFI